MREIIVLAIYQHIYQDGIQMFEIELFHITQLLLFLFQTCTVAKYFSKYNMSYNLPENLPKIGFQLFHSYTSSCSRNVRLLCIITNIRSEIDIY